MIVAWRGEPGYRQVNGAQCREEGRVADLDRAGFRARWANPAADAGAQQVRGVIQGNGVPDVVEAIRCHTPVYADLIAHIASGATNGASAGS